MDDETVSELEHENQCSIEFSRNAKGEYSWKIKRYHGLDEQADALQKIQQANGALQLYEAALRKG